MDVEDCNVFCTICKICLSTSIVPSHCAPARISNNIKNIKNISYVSYRLCQLCELLMQRTTNDHHIIAFFWSSIWWKQCLSGHETRWLGVAEWRFSASQASQDWAKQQGHDDLYWSMMDMMMVIYGDDDDDDDDDDDENQDDDDDNDAWWLQILQFCSMLINLFIFVLSPDMPPYFPQWKIFGICGVINLFFGIMGQGWMLTNMSKPWTSMNIMNLKIFECPAKTYPPRSLSRLLNISMFQIFQMLDSNSRCRPGSCMLLWFFNETFQTFAHVRCSIFQHIQQWW